MEKNFKHSREDEEHTQLLFNGVLEVLAREIKEEEYERDSNRRGRGQSNPVADYVILHTVTPLGNP